MTKRFTSGGLNHTEGIIKDNLNKCPLQDIPIPIPKIASIVDWLNNNVKEYHRFELQTYITNKGHQAYNLWDNEKDKNIPFTPVINDSYNYKRKFEE